MFAECSLPEVSMTCGKESLPGFADEFSKLAVRLMRGTEVQKRSVRLALMLAALPARLTRIFTSISPLDNDHRELPDRQTTVKKLLIAPKLAGSPPQVDAYPIPARLRRLAGAVSPW